MSTPRLPISISRILTRQPLIVLIVLYIVSLTIHGVITFACSILPSIMTDELMYLELAKSIYDGDGLLFRSQPISYQYILYPFIIAPLFGLPESVNIYNAIMVFNLASIHLMIFPAYALTKEITGRKDMALLVAFIVCLMPDLAMAKHIMVESVAYPLLLTTLWLSFRLIKQPTVWGGRTLGILGWLLYLIKPGYAAIVAVPVIAILISGLSGKNRPKTICGLNALIALLIGLLPGMWLVRTLFRVDTSQVALYAQQTQPLTLNHILQTGLGTIKYACFTLIAFCAMPIAATIQGIKTFKDERRTFCAVLLASIIVILVGTVYVIYFDEYIKTGNIPTRIHLRYLSFFLPACIAILLTDEMRNNKMRVPLLVIGEVLIIGLFIAPMAAFEGSQWYVVDSALLSAMLGTFGVWIGKSMYLPIFLTCTLLLGALVSWRGLTTWLRRVTLIFLMALILCNQAAMYTSDRYAMNLSLDADAQAVNSTVEGDAIYLCEDGGSLGYEAVALSVYSRCNILPVELSAMIKSTKADGTATQILPNSYDDKVFSSAKNPYPMPRNLVIAPILTESMRFDADVICVLNAEQGSYQVLRIPEDGAWLHSALYGLQEKWVDDESGFILCDDAMLDSGVVTIWLKVRAGVDGACLTLVSPDGQWAKFQPSANIETEWIYATFTVNDRSIPFNVSLAHEDGNIFIETYLVQAGYVSE